MVRSGGPSSAVESVLLPKTDSQQAHVVARAGAAAAASALLAAALIVSAVGLVVVLAVTNKLVSAGCEAAPCLHGGLCTVNRSSSGNDDDDGFSCECGGGWGGTTCSHPTTPAAPHHQCNQPYANISDTWRSVYHDCSGGGCPSPGCEPPPGPAANCSCGVQSKCTWDNGTSHRDKGGPGQVWAGDVPIQKGGCCGSSKPCDGKATGVGGNRWYRFVGPAGDSLPLSPPGVDHCGASKAGWLSGWDRPGNPDSMYKGGGKLPATSDGVVEKTVCFVHGPPNANTWCDESSRVAVVRCAGFYLWRLSYSGNCVAAYCTAHSQAMMV